MKGKAALQTQPWPGKSVLGGSAKEACQVPRPCAVNLTGKERFFCKVQTVMQLLCSDPLSESHPIQEDVQIPQGTSSLLPCVLTSCLSHPSSWHGLCVTGTGMVPASRPPAWRLVPAEATRSQILQPGPGLIPRASPGCHLPLHATRPRGAQRHLPLPPSLSASVVLPFPVVTSGGCCLPAR